MLCVLAISCICGYHNCKLCESAAFLLERALQSAGYSAQPSVHVHHGKRTMHCFHEFRDISETQTATKQSLLIVLCCSLSLWLAGQRGRCGTSQHIPAHLTCDVWLERLAMPPCCKPYAAASLQQGLCHSCNLTAEISPQSTCPQQDLGHSCSAYGGGYATAAVLLMTNSHVSAQLSS